MFRRKHGKDKKMAVPTMGQKLAMKVELRIECRNLMNKDVLSKSDPIVVVEDLNTKTVLDRTERVVNNLNPKFEKSIFLDYNFEQVQKLKFSVYDIDNDSATLNDDDFLGAAECTLGQIVSAKKFSCNLVLQNNTLAGKGSMMVRQNTTKLIQHKFAHFMLPNDIAILSFRATHLDKKDVVGKSDPFLEFFKEGSNAGEWQKVHTTEVVKNTLNPTWKPFKIPVMTLCSGNLDKKIKIECWDHDFNGKHDLIGEFYTTLRQLEAVNKKQVLCFDHDEASAPDLIGDFYTTTRQLIENDNRQVEWECINPKKKAKKKNYKNSGVIFLTESKIKRQYTFLDYIFGGTQINFTAAIDFTGSNGDPREPTSLHYISESTPNEYTKAIIAVGEVIQDYDTDKLFPALGFGAKIPPNNEVSHEFAINFTPSNPFCAGVMGIVAAYQNCVRQVQLWGPTNVSPVIDHVARFAESSKQNSTPNLQQYFVLLVLTDGVITDMYETRNAIVRASHLPMSIIIIGVGEADFTDMQKLDGDDGILKSPSGEPAARDIVQFVPFRDFKNSTPAALAKCVLAEVPKQLSQYFDMQQIPPLNHKP
ncbi:copine-3-like [Anneissia japonica]|uniref:copine-3-like n=1 Tax=Anneissia japonica TaxID=1529436 RepID=UPI001425BB3C|nr:copine-3-like [Anneissia japonica]